MGYYSNTLLFHVRTVHHLDDLNTWNITEIDIRIIITDHTLEYYKVAPGEDPPPLG